MYLRETFCFIPLTICYVNIINVPHKHNQYTAWHDVNMRNEHRENTAWERQTTSTWLDMLWTHNDIITISFCLYINGTHTCVNTWHTIFSVRSLLQTVQWNTIQLQSACAIRGQHDDPSSCLTFWNSLLCLLGLHVLLADSQIYYYSHMYNIQDLYKYQIFHNNLLNPHFTSSVCVNQLVVV